MKRLVFCFDGTWNKLDAEHPTNVVLTAESVLPQAKDAAQLIYYDEGVGTGGVKDYWEGGLLGVGLLQNLADAYRFLIFNHTYGDQIYIFGFSRGAFTARSFAGLLSCSGVLDRRNAGKAKDAVDLYKSREDTPEYIERAMCFRRDYSSDTWVSDQERDWRKKNAAHLLLDDTRRVRVTYVGVWDTVGALGVPDTFIFSQEINRKYQFHDTKLSNFVCSARHAVAIDEKREEFRPTLWTNLEELNREAGSSAEAINAPYQQKWFPGVHSSVGGGADQRGLSDQALHWVWVGAMRMGLQFDTEQHSRIFELAPKFTDKLLHTDDPGLAFREMSKHGSYRMPGPAHLYEVSFSAQRRWHENPQMLPEKKAYRPDTLNAVAAQLAQVDPMELGVGDKFREMLAKEKYEMYTVKQGNQLRALAKLFYGNADEATKIFNANRDVLEDPSLIFAKQVLRLPKTGLIAIH